MLTTEQLDELDRLEKAATNAPWVDGEGGLYTTHRGPCRVVDRVGTDDDFAIIAASRNALPELLAMARQLLRAREMAPGVRAVTEVMRQIHMAATANQIDALLDAIDGKVER
jgi:hypothetical protein